MTALIVIGAALLLVVLHLRGERRAEDARVARVLAGFGKPVDRERDPEVASAWFCGTRDAHAPASWIDDRTWADLDMDEVLRLLDRTVSQVGAQCLYATLRFPWPDGGVRKPLEQLTEFLRTQAVERTSVMRELERYGSM